MKKFKHMLTYVGNGIWTDSKGNKWTNGDSQEFDVDMDKDEFLNERKDLGFMVQYGTIKINSMSIDAKAPQEPSENQGNIKKTAEAISQDTLKEEKKNKTEGDVKKITIVNTK